MYSFLRAGQFPRVERLGRILNKLGTGAADELGQIGGDGSRGAAAVAFGVLAKTDFIDLVLSDLASESAERSDGSLGALRQVASVAQDRLVDVVRQSSDYRLRRLAAEALASTGGSGGVAAIAQLGPTTPPEEYERIVSVIDALGLEAETAEEEVVQAINHAAEPVRMAAVSVAYRLADSSALGILQRSINAGGTLSALRTLQAVGELRMVEALPIVQKQLMDSQDAAVVEAGCRAIGRMAPEADTPSLRVVRLLGTVLDRLPGFGDKEEAERAALTALWALGQYRIPEAHEAIEKAKSYPSVKVSVFAGSVLERGEPPA
jgi:hypothetical protein